VIVPEPSMPGPTPQCPFCTATSLDSTDAAGDHVFFSCPHCGRRFAREGDDPLVERWPGPLSIALYGAQFSRDPAQEAERLASHLVAGLASDPERRQAMIAAIDDELRMHRQPVQDILPGMPASEAQLRDYLRRFADFLRDDAWVARQLGDGRGRAR
jgi:hypothetical protein